MTIHEDDPETERRGSVKPVVPPPPGMRAADVGTPARRGWLPWALAGVIVAAAIAVVLIVTVFSSSDDASQAYKLKIQGIMRPVVRANASLSRTLAKLHGTDAAAAQRSVAAAQAATLTARGGLNALTVPDGADQIASNARGTLTREASYLSTLREALSNPGSGSAAQTQTLAGNLAGALDVIAPADQDWSGSVTGADTLTSWATHAAAAARRKRAAERRRSEQAQSIGAASVTPVSGGTPCGDNVYAGPNTSCPFALNTRRAYEAAPGITATVTVYSPVTGQTYSMSCAPAGNGITCSGANNASVTWTY